MKPEKALAAAVAGAVIAVLVAYVGYKMNDRYFTTFREWLTFDGSKEVALIAGLGAVAAVALAYLFQSRQN